MQKKMIETVRIDIEAGLEMTNPQETNLDDERKKVVSKSRKWLMDYLNYIASEGSMTEKNKKQLFRVIGDAYRKNLLDDEAFFERARDFVDKRRSADEKARFFRDVVTHLVSQGVVAENYAKKYPDEYRIKEKDS